MLIKLGNIWVDPEKVMCLEPSPSEPTTLVWLPGTPDDCVNAEIPADEAAEIINRALAKNDPEAFLHSFRPLVDLDEQTLLEQAYADGFRWIARDQDGNLYAYQSRPIKAAYNAWDTTDGCSRPIFPDDILQFIQWEDPNPTGIAWLLGKEAET